MTALCLYYRHITHLDQVFLHFSFLVEFMPVDSEREEELQEERGLSQLETRLQHLPVHVRPPQVWTLTGQHSQSVLSRVGYCLKNDDTSTF